MDRALEGELTLEPGKVLGAHSAVDTDVALLVHIVLGEDVGLDVVLDVILDTDRVPKVAVVEDRGGALGLCIVLGMGKDVEQDVGISAVMASDIDPDAGLGGSLGVVVTLHVALALGRKRPRKIVGQNSQNSI